MRYKEILKKLSIKENVSVKEIECEMQAAINNAGLDCSAKEFIETISFFIAKRRYIA